MLQITAINFFGVVPVHSGVAQLGARPRGFKFRLKKQSKSWENDVNDF